MRENLSWPLSLAIVVGLSAWLLLPAQATAGDFSLNFDQTFAGTAPGPYSQPWLQAQFQTLAPGSVRLTLRNSGSLGSASVEELFFNLNPGLNAACLSFHLVESSPGLEAPLLLGGNDRFKVQTAGKFDFELSFEHSCGAGGLFSAGQFLVYDISGGPTLSAEDFACGSNPPWGGSPYYGAAHLVEISHGQFSGWVAPTQLTPLVVPEPGLLSLAVLGLGISLSRRRGKRG